MKLIDRPGGSVNLSFHKDFHAGITTGCFRRIHMKLETIVDGERLKACGFGDFMDFPPADNWGHFGRGSSELEAFAQQVIVESP